ncbi:WxcM-like domain-containing protein [Verrucomicrobia bacterium]|nr:WxcM-like domain-containing protein [Verrucomicrobiota bacterium]
MDGVILTSLKEISCPKGNIFHVIKERDNDFFGFGEAYFSSVHKDRIKGWKMHKEMILNLVVITGEINFVIHNISTKDFFSVTLSRENYNRLTIMPGLWIAFKGIKKENILLNIASIEHDPTDSVNMSLDSIEFEF